MLLWQGTGRTGQAICACATQRLWVGRPKGGVLVVRGTNHVRVVSRLPQSVRFVAFPYVDCMPALNPATWANPCFGAYGLGA